MSKKAKYIEIELIEERRNIQSKEFLDKYAVTRKVNKASNIDILDLILNDSNVKSNIGTTLYRSNPSYGFWSSFAADFRNQKDRYTKIVPVLRTLLTINDNFSGDGRNLFGLMNIIEYQDEFVRPIETWLPKSRNATNQFISLLRHLFTIYDTPTFLEKSFYGSGDFFEGIYMYMHLGKGKSMKNFDGYPVNMIIQKKAAHYLYSTPDDMEYHTALRRIQVLYMGGDEYIFKALMRSNQLRERIPVTRIRKEGEKDYTVDLSKEEFWLSVMKFFIDNTMIEPSKIAEVVDYIYNMKYVKINTYVDGRSVTVDPPHPNFSMKGRTPTSLINHSDQWHYEKERLNRVNRLINGNNGRYKSKQIENYSWGGYTSILNASFKRGKQITYKVVQLKSYYELRDEGNEMHHCVATYASSCSSGRTAIFSVREYLHDHFVGRCATLEVRANQIVQIRSKYNRKPDDKIISIIKEWASSQLLSITSFAL
jgi:hypothetical protein